MNYIKEAILIVIVSLVFQGCKNQKDELIAKYNAQIIDFSQYDFTIDFQDKVYNRKILFSVYLADIFRQDENVIFLLSNEVGYFKLTSDKIDYSFLERNDEVNVVALITDYDFYQMNSEEYWGEEMWSGPILVFKGELISIVKK